MTYLSTAIKKARYLITRDSDQVLILEKNDGAFVDLVMDTPESRNVAITNAINNLLAGVPGALDTLDELAAALGDDANFAATVTAALSQCLRSGMNLSDLTSPSSARTNLGLGSAAVHSATEFDTPSARDTAVNAAISAAIATLINSAPTALDTLDELAAALGDDANFSATITTALAARLQASMNLSDLSNISLARTNLGLDSAALRSDTYFDTPAGRDAAINTAITNLLNGAPGALDTLNELATALGDDPNFATTIATALSARLVWRGPWASGTTYAANDLVTYNSGFYRASSTFTSGATFTITNWVELVPQAGTYARSVIFDVRDYGLVVGDTTTHLTGFAAAYAAAAVAGGIVQFPGGTYTFSATAVQSAINMVVNHPGLVTIRGVGLDATVLKLTANVPALVSNLGGAAGNTNTYQKLTVEDITVDANNVGTTGGMFGVVFDSAARANYDSITIRRVKTINVPTTTSGSDRRNVNMTVSTTPEGIGGVGGTSAPLYTVTNFFVDNCRFLGGNYGVTCSGFFSNNNAPTTVNSSKFPKTTINPNALNSSPAQLPYTIANVFLDLIHFRGSYHDTLLGPQVASFSSANFMIGGHGYGGRWLIEDCEGHGSVDTGIEVDSGTDVTVRNTKIVDAHSESFYWTNIGGDPGSEDQTIRFIDCTAERLAATSGFCLATGRATIPWSNPMGHLVVRNFRVRSRVPADSGTFDIAIFGDPRSVDIDGVYIDNRWSSTIAASQTMTAINIALFDRMSRVSIKNVDDEFCPTIDAPSVRTITRQVINAPVLADSQIVIDNVRWRHRPTLTNSGRFSSVGIKIGSSSSSSLVDEFPTNANRASLYSDYWVDAGANDNVTQAARLLTAAANLGTENRYVWAGNIADTANGKVGPLTDAVISIPGKPGPTVTGFKLGCFKRIDSANYVEAYVSDDGAASTLKLDKIIGGTRTNLASTALGARIANGTRFWVSLRAQGSSYVAGYWTADPGDFSTGTPTSTAAFTLSATDAATFQVGWLGFTFTPVDLADTVGTGVANKGFRLDRLNVVCGEISNVRAGSVINSTTTTQGIRIDVGTTKIRFPRRLRIRDHDYGGLASNTGIAEISMADTTVGPFIESSNIGYVTPLQPTAIAYPGSLTAWTNALGYSVDLFAYNGTVTKIEVSTDSGTTWVQIGTTTPFGGYRVLPGMQARFTSTANPTLVAVPA